MGVVRVSPKLIVCKSWHLCKWEDISPLLRLTDTDVSDIIKGKFLSLRGKGSTLGAWKFSKFLGSKFTLLFLVLQPRSDTLEGYNPLVGAALLCRHIYQPPWPS